MAAVAPDGFRVRRSTRAVVSGASSSIADRLRVTRWSAAEVGASMSATADLTATDAPPPEPSPLADRLRAAAAEILAVADELDAQDDR